MAFFKFRKGVEEPPAPAPAPESVELLRKRARYRLAGAAVLVLAGVIGFPLLFDNQPRPIAVDIPIDIPDQAKVPPLPALSGSASAQAKGAVASGSVAPASDLAAASAAVTAPVSPAAPAAATAVAPGPAAVALANPAAVLKPATTTRPAASSAAPLAPKPTAASPAAKGGDSVLAKAQPREEVLIPSAAEQKQAGAAAGAASAVGASGRFIVQFGAYSDAAKAHEARLRVEKAGLKTYAQMVLGADGKRFRVRVGPFDKRADAEKAAEKIKKLDLPAAILEL